MWLIYTSLVVIVLAIVMFIWSALISIKGMIVTVKHLSEVTEKAREQAESIKKEQEKLLSNISFINEDLNEKKNSVQEVLNEGKVLIQFLKKITNNSIRKINDF